MDEYRRELYEDRAEWADFESDISEARKYAVVGGWFWRLCDWFERMARKERQEIQAEIDAMNNQEPPEA